MTTSLSESFFLLTPIITPKKVDKFGTEDFIADFAFIFYFIVIMSDISVSDVKRLI